MLALGFDELVSGRKFVKNQVRVARVIEFGPLVVDKGPKTTEITGADNIGRGGKSGFEIIGLASLEKIGINLIVGLVSGIWGKRSRLFWGGIRRTGGDGLVIGDNNVEII